MKVVCRGIADVSGTHKYSRSEAHRHRERLARSREWNLLSNQLKRLLGAR
jgi:hypothetical protein